MLSNESHALLAHLTFDLEHARQETREIARSVDALDSDLAAAIAARDAAGGAVAQADEAVDQQNHAALARAHTIYSEAVARERRASVLEAHGITATQELEAAQMAVRAAASELASLRRTLVGAAAAGAARASETQSHLERAIAEKQRQRENRAMALVEARQRQREAELALASARQRLGMRVRARLEGIVTELSARSGQQIAAGAALITIAVDSAAALD